MMSERIMAACVCVYPQPAPGRYVTKDMRATGNKMINSRFPRHDTKEKDSARAPKESSVADVMQMLYRR